MLMSIRILIHVFPPYGSRVKCSFMPQLKSVTSQLFHQVLPTSSDDGLVEFVPSMPLSKVLSEHRTIHKYLAQWQADPAGAWDDGRVTEWGVLSKPWSAMIRRLDQARSGSRSRRSRRLCAAARGAAWLRTSLGSGTGTSTTSCWPRMGVCSTSTLDTSLGKTQSRSHLQWRFARCEGTAVSAGRIGRHWSQD